MTRGTLTSIKYCIDRFNLLVTEGGYNLELGFLRNTFGVAILSFITRHKSGAVGARAVFQ